MQISFLSIERHQSVLNTVNVFSQARNVDITPQTWAKGTGRISDEQDFGSTSSEERFYNTRSDGTDIKLGMTPAKLRLSYLVNISHNTGVVKNNSQASLLGSSSSYVSYIYKFITIKNEKQRARLWSWVFLYVLDILLTSWDSKL